MSNNLVGIPVEAFYTKNHEWMTVEENVVTVGITSFATEYLGEILYADLPDEGTRINYASSFATLESARNIMDLVGSFTGTILEVNTRLLDDPSIVNDDPYGEGWIFVAEIENERDLAGLLRHSDYKILISQKKQSEAEQ